MVRDLKDSRLAFIGKILSMFTHELKNHLAIISESAGLMGDIIEMEQGAAGGTDKFSEIISSIAAQVQAISALTKYLNRFGHRMDCTLSTFDINEAVEELAVLMSRFAGQRLVRIETSLDAGLPGIYGNPSLFQYALSTLVFSAIESFDSQKKSTLTIKTQSKGDFTEITMFKSEKEGLRLVGDGGSHDLSPWQHLHATVSQDGQGSLVITIPNNI
ncbi:MAG: hypothetical protein H7844_02125 [Nitrospirae bacterium YQR-1]